MSAALPVRILLLGHGALGLALLQGLLATRGVAVVGVFQWCARAGRRYEPKEAVDRAFARLVRAQGLEAIRDAGANSFAFSQTLARLQPDCLLIGSWGEILKPHLLERSGLTVINCHPSRLPSHRGANPYVSAVSAGETETGVTFHRVDAGIDTGPILRQYPVPILPHDTGGDVRDRCAQQARQRVGDIVALLHQARQEPHVIAGTPQDAFGQAHGIVPSSFGMLSLTDGYLDWTMPPPVLINRVRALQPWLDAYGYLPTRLSRRHLISFSGLNVLPQDTPCAAPPGTLLAMTPDGLQVASCDPHVVFQLRHVRVFIAAALWPVAWPYRLARWILRPGSRFHAPARPSP